VTPTKPAGAEKAEPTKAPGGAATAAPAATKAPAPAEPTKAAAPASLGTPKPGGTIKIAIYQEPANLNPFLNTQTVGSVVRNTIFSGLISVNEKGEYVPELATEVPTTQNGGVSADGKTVTFKLRKDVKWHDGKPFTAADVKFTYDVIMDAANPVTSRSGYRDLESVTSKDEATVELKFKNFYAPFLTLFGVVLPAHAFGGSTAIEKADFNRKPIGTGAFKFVEWVSGDHITVAKNPTYYVTGKPYLDQVIFRVTPSREVGIAQLKTGEADVVWNLIEAQIPEFDGNPEINVWASPGLGVERLILNFSSPSGDKAGDPTTKHPILSDPKVREAIELGINKKVIVDKLLYGKATVGSSPLSSGWAAPKVAPSEYAPDKAKKLLDEAGWKPGSDGIRAKDGVKASLTYQTTSGDKLRELAQQDIQEQMKEIGIALEIKNIPSASLLGTWADNAPRAKGTFDINMWTTNPGIDPHAHLYIYYHSSQIPTEANKGEGQNYSRLRDSEVDKALDEAGSVPDQEKRKAAYERAIKGVTASRAHIFLYNRLDVDGARKHVVGRTHNPWDNLGWDIEAWWLNK
jgi:peptide/nickel transport system substrate-binding protein